MNTPRTKIGLKDVRAIAPGQTIWDSAVRGFGARRQKSAAISYILFYRTSAGRQRLHTIGRHGSPWTPDMAREHAKSLLVEVVRGGDPAETKHEARHGITVTELCDQYVADVKAGRALTRRRTPKKPSTMLSDASRIERHIKPLLGRLKVASVTQRDIERLMHAVAAGETAAKTKTAKGFSNVRGGQGSASRAVGLLGGIFSYAVKKRMRPDNPVRGVERPADGRKTRRLTDAEYPMLGVGLLAATEAHRWPPAVAAARFLLLTGWRTGEALGLRWSELDLDRRTATLGDTKTGRSLRPLSAAACDVLRGQRLVGELVFPPARGTARMIGPNFQYHFAQIAALGGLPKDITPHVLRHSFASVAGDLGYSEPTIAALIGHTGQSMTSRYVHAADAVLLAAADRVAGEILGRIGS